MLVFPQLKHNEKVLSGQKRNHGQIVIEYVLLLVVTVTLAVVLTKGLIGRNAEDPEEQGVILQKWEQLRQAIANDNADAVD